ncbi:MAG: hypothetical protein ACXWDE_12740, partial [Aeromicrobium sp.]
TTTQVSSVTAITRAISTKVADLRKAARLLVGGVGLLLVFASCASDSASPTVGSAVTNSTTTVVGVAVPPTAATDPAAPTTTLAVASTTPAVDGAALLQSAVAALGAGYHFNQTATIDGNVALTVDGDRLPTGVRLAVTSPAAGLVYYVITPDGTWLMPDNGEWEADDSPAPAVDPIDALGSPTSVTVGGNDGTTVQLVVTVPFSSLGVDTEGDAALQVVVVSGALSTITYSTTTSDGKPASTATIIGPVVDASPVVAPI